MDVVLSTLKPCSERTMLAMALSAALLGGILVAIGITDLWKDAIVLGWSLLFLFSSFACLSAWRTRSGLWMASVLVCLVALAVIIAALWSLFHDALLGINRTLRDLLLTLTVVASWMWCLWISARCGIANWWLFKNRLNSDGGNPLPPAEGTGIPVRPRRSPPGLAAQAEPARTR